MCTSFSFSRQDDKKFLASELLHFNVEHLRIIVETLKSKIDDLTIESVDSMSENRYLSEDQKALKNTLQNLEEMAFRVMKPWVNSMPQSDEMTRVMLLN